MKPFAKEEVIRGMVARLLDCEAAGVRLAPSPTGRFNSTWFVEAEDLSCVLRIAPAEDRSRMLFYEHRMMLQEPSVHDQVLRHTSVPVPGVIAFEERSAELDRDCLLLERLPGRPLSMRSGLVQADLDRVLFELGESLRQVHAILGTAYGYLGPHRPMEPQADWTSAFRTMWSLLLADIEGCGGYDASEAAWMRQLLERHSGAFERNVPPSLLHMDVWGENILVGDEGELSGLLDWDRALWGDPEIEYAVLEYCGISESAFWEGYGGRPERDEAFQVRQVFYLLYEVQKYIVISLQRHGNRQRAELYRQRALDLTVGLGG